jgi:hypothetical protein
VALAAGFGLNLETCDPEIFDELVDLLEERGKEMKRNQMEQELKAKMGR